MLSNGLSKFALKILENDEVDYNIVCDGENALSLACINGFSEVALALLKKPNIDL